MQAIMAHACSAGGEIDWPQALASAVLAVGSSAISSAVQVLYKCIL